ncbi:hypothetical protein B0T26DRAFT_724201 [Lasiosphaeria miniovina]|uniref:HNH nuclease domain-containing protein n=1 Tax=Lasiosphaeria miniovina TaxID=1954250 RepID=A0AA40DSA7_9PEZI|nr:uncharacterized protein B0T26DRAFT_724201 [Lasiosphaeria miniovina]KAK0710148.1 hypothetical protein B0T26DRAFT_724201 [Lasiosphaeria miniovina]
MEWIDPLRNMSLGVSHPAPESVASSELSSVFNNDEEWYDARNSLVDTLKHRYTPNGPEDDTFTVLRVFVMKLPKDGQLALMSEIYDLMDDPPKLRQLRNFLVGAILKPMKAAGGKGPKTPITPSPHAAARDEVLLSMTTIEPSSRKDQPRLKANCLQREGYRCALSRYIDMNMRHKVSASTAPTTKIRTHCACILPFALGNFDEEKAQGTENKAMIWWALYRYFPDLKGQIGPESINQCQNAITMWTALHEEFGCFNLALEPLGNDRYQVHWLICEGISIPPIITFTSNDPSVPLPDPKYLWCHFRVAEILEVSGIGQKITDTMDSEAWDPENIDPNGSTDIGSILSRKMLTGI